MTMAEITLGQVYPAARQLAPEEQEGLIERLRAEREARVAPRYSDLVLGSAKRGLR